MYRKLLDCMRYCRCQSLSQRTSQPWAYLGLHTPFTLHSPQNKHLVKLSGLVARLRRLSLGGIMTWVDAWAGEEGAGDVYDEVGWGGWVWC